MTTTSAPGEGAELPVIPAPRDHGCPLKPPAAVADWRAADGLQLALWRGEPAWVVSKYEDIRAALVDPRLSAETLPDALKLMGTGDNVPVVFARVDDP